MKLLAPVLPSDKILNQIAVKIADFTEVQDLIEQMLILAGGEQGDKKRRTMVGLAAPQVGISKRIVVVDVATDGSGDKTPDFQVFINPAITGKSDELEIGREGCFSTGNVCGIVERHKNITVKAHDQNGKLFTEKYHGFTARILQHEIDHLNGIRFPDRITDDSKLHWVEPDEFGDYRTGWQNWQKLCLRQRWLGIKGANDD